MPLQVFLSHASVDKAIVLEVKQALEEGGDIQCWVDAFEIGLGDNIGAKIQEGLRKSDLLLLFLSATSVKSRWVEEEWTTAHWKQVNSGEVRLIPVLIGDCQLPALLEDKKYCDLRTNRLEGMRVLKTELLRLRPAPVFDGGSRASLPNFVGREAELKELKERLSQPGALVPIIGMPGVGKTWLAREFLRRYAALFEAVYELDCQKKNLAALTGELAMKLGLRLEGDAEKVAGELRSYLSGKRCLLLLDNVDDDQPGALVPGGKAAVLVTARNGNTPFLADYPDLYPKPFTDDEALEVFRRVLGSFPEDAAKRLFIKLGHLPIGITVAAGLIKHDVRYTVESLADDLPLAKLVHGKQDVSRLLGDAIGALSESGQALLRAIAACAPGGTRLGLAADVAGLKEADALNALQDLFERSLVVEIDRASRRYRLHPLIREAASPGMEVRRRHMEVVAQRLEAWEKSPLAAAGLIEESDEALRAWSAGPERSIVLLALRAGNLSQALGRLSEAYAFSLCVEEFASAAGQKRWLPSSYGNRAIILRAWGRLDDALSMHEEEDRICREIGDAAGSQRSYANRALVLRAMGRFEDARKFLDAEKLLPLDAWSAAANCGNQALVLADEGRLDEAMGLHHEEERRLKELGDDAGLSISYGNQARILAKWGQFDRAMELLRKKEHICKARGNRADIALCDAYIGRVENERGNFEESRRRLESALAIFTELNMPRERDVVAVNLAKLTPPPANTGQ